MERTYICKKCIIVGAGEFNGFVVSPVKGQDIIIAADGGLDYLSELDIVPDIWVGDADSIKSDTLKDGFSPETEQIKLPCEKNETDMLVAVRKGMEMGCREFHIYGGCGGRFDHTYANITTLSEIAKSAAVGYMYHGRSMMTVIENGGISFPKMASGMISVFSLSDISRGVTIRGLKYEVESIDLASTSSLGCSNEFIDKPSMIEVKEGRLLIVMP